MTTLYNTFQNSLIQYAGYTGATGGMVIPPAPPASGNTQYYTGVPTSIPSGSAVVYSLTLQGQVGDVFTMFLTGSFNGNNATITPSFDGNAFTYTTAAGGGGSYTYETTISIRDAATVVITNTAFSSGAISPNLGFSATTTEQKFGTGTRSMNMVAGVPMTVTLQHINEVTVNAFSIFKFASA